MTNPSPQPLTASSKVRRKVEKIRSKTEEARKLFNLVESETVIQDYSCSVKKVIPCRGRMYITQNYICWAPIIGSTCEVIPFRTVTAIVSQATLIMPSSIDITTDGAVKSFVNFIKNHSKECLNVLTYLWKNVPSYVSLETENDHEETKNKQDGTARKTTLTNDPKNKNNKKEELHVDVELSKKALQLAQETHDLTTGTLEELNRQAETINQIEKDIEHIHANLDRGDRYIRSMEGITGVIKNAFSKDNSHQVDLKQSPVTQIHRKPQTLDYQILLKNPDNSLKSCLLRFTDDKFMCVTEDTKLLIGHNEWKYEFVTAVVLRARHLHLDIKFGSQPRFRLLSSFVQAITNELVLRTEVGQVQVEFEPGVRSFSFGSFKVSDQIQSKLGRDRSVTGKGAPKASDILSDQVSQKVKDDFDKQEANLLLLERIVDNITDANVAIGQELERQNHQLHDLNNRVDGAKIHTEVATKRAQKLLT